MKRNFGKIKMVFFQSQYIYIYIFFFSIYRENWSILSKLLHRTQSGEALWARVFLFTGNSSMYSWVKSTKVYKIRDFPGGPKTKRQHANAGDAVLISGSGRSPGERMEIHSSIRAWRIPWTEEPGGQQYMGHKEWTTTESLNNWTCLVNELWAELTFPFRAGTLNSSTRVLRALYLD